MEFCGSISSRSLIPDFDAASCTVGDAVATILVLEFLSWYASSSAVKACRITGHDSVSLFISFNKNILTTFQPVTLAFIRFEVIHKLTSLKYLIKLTSLKYFY